MAAVAHTFTKPAKQAAKVSWASIATGDTPDAYTLQGVQGGIGSVQATGTFNGGTTVTLTASNDGTNYETLFDLQGTAISLTAAGRVDFTTAALYIKPAVASGSADSITVTLVLRDPQGQ